jgi:hypothetical protein
MKKSKEEHSFSIEMKTEGAVRKMSLIDMKLFFEGFLGALRNINVVEGVMLEIEGANGILKLDINQKELEDCILPRSTARIRGEHQ